MSIREEASVFGFVARWIIGFVVLGAVISGGFWWFNVATSDIQGRGNQKIQINSAENRTFQYEHFFQLDADIRTQAEAADAARTKVAKFEKLHPNADSDNYATTQLRGELDQDETGAEQICRTNVNQYNNETRSILRQKFVDNHLPAFFPVAVCTDVSQLPSSAADRQ